MIATHHVHTLWSDGIASVAQMIDAAMVQGIDEIGISDHFCIRPDGLPSDCTVDPDRIDDYLADVLEAKNNSNITVLLGLEIDWFEENSNRIDRIIEHFPLDYRIGSIHHVKGETFDYQEDYWAQKSQSEIDRVYHDYWIMVREMAESGLFDIIGHLDLPKKFGYYPSADMSRVIQDALNAIQRNNLVLEYSTAGFRKPCKDGYPSLELLKACRDKDIPVTVSSDAHTPEHLVYGFDQAIDLLISIGYSEIARIHNRQVSFEPIENARPLKTEFN